MREDFILQCRNGESDLCSRRVPACAESLCELVRVVVEEVLWREDLVGP